MRRMKEIMALETKFVYAAMLDMIEETLKT